MYSLCKYFFTEMTPKGVRPAKADVGNQSYCAETAWFLDRSYDNRFVEVIFQSVTVQLFPYNDLEEMSNLKFDPTDVCAARAGSEDDVDEARRLSLPSVLLVVGGTVGILLAGVFYLLAVYKNRCNQESKNLCATKLC